MRILGIDYGSKRIGLALSDASNTLAFPHSVLHNDKKLFEHIAEIITKEHIEKIVIGESKNFQGEANTIMKEIEEFVENLKKETQVPVMFEPEFLSSFQAERFQGKTELLDASAAAIILQSYLDRKHT